MCPCWHACCGVPVQLLVSAHQPSAVGNPRYCWSYAPVNAAPPAAQAVQALGHSNGRSLANASGSCKSQSFLRTGITCSQCVSVHLVNSSTAWNSSSFLEEYCKMKSKATCLVLLHLANLQLWLCFSLFLLTCSILMLWFSVWSQLALVQRIHFMWAVDWMGTSCTDYHLFVEPIRGLKSWVFLLIPPPPPPIFFLSWPLFPS